MNKLSKRMRKEHDPLVYDELVRDWADEVEVLEARCERLERESELYKQLAVFKDAKSISFNTPADYGLAIYTLRDLPLNKRVWARRPRVGASQRGH